MHLPGLRVGQEDVKRGTVRMFGMSYGKTTRRRSRAAGRLRLGHPGLGSGVGLSTHVPRASIASSKKRLAAPAELHGLDRANLLPSRIVIWEWTSDSGP